MYIKIGEKDKAESKEAILNGPDFIWEILYGCSPSGGPFITHDLAARLKTRLLDISSYYIF